MFGVSQSVKETLNKKNFLGTLALKEKKAIQRHIGSYFDIFIKSDGMRKRISCQSTKRLQYKNNLFIFYRFPLSLNRNFYRVNQIKFYSGLFEALRQESARAIVKFNLPFFRVEFHREASFSTFLTFFKKSEEKFVIISVGSRDKIVKISHLN